MKLKINVTIDEEKLKLVEKLLESGKYRNKSHVMEYSLTKLLQEESQNVN
jgi:Arc/MetJ-type ribon-helix-helix transcriptional regulator